MCAEKTYNVSLKITTDDNGVYQSVRILRGRSELPDETLNQINNALYSCLVPTPPVRTTVAIGDDAEQKVMNHLLKISSMNSDFDVIDTSAKTGHGDMAVIHRGRKICIEVKCYTKPVPMKEIDKYHNSLSFAEYDAGIMIQMNSCGFARESGLKTPIDLKFSNEKPSVYLTAIDLQMIYPIILMIIMMKGTEICESEIEEKQKALLAIHEKITDLRSAIDAQKKAISKTELLIEDIAKLSCV